MPRSTAFALCCLAIAALVTSANAQEDTRARLLTAVDAAALNDNFPPVALALGQSGHVTLSCDVAVDGSSTCSVGEQSPQDAGFGAAALALSLDWTFAPAIQGGQPVASVRRVSIAFQNESSVRQIVQSTIAVDARRGDSASPANSTDLDDVELAALACSWAGQFCWPLDPSSTADRFRNTEHYPTAARDAGIEGRALIACAIRTSARADCAVEGETPAGSEFGAAALQLVSETANRMNLPAGTVFRVPVQFELHRGSRPNRTSPWDQTPSGGDFARAYPDRAIERNMDGRALLLCEIQATRRLHCAVLAESPQDIGFGEAAINVATSFRVSEEVFGSPGFTVGERFRRTIRFNIR